MRTKEHFLDVVWFYVPLESFPPARQRFQIARVADVNELIIDGREYALYLKRRNWGDWDPLWQVPQRGLALQGIRAGRVYEVEEWLFDDRAIRLRGIEGTYYSGLFEDGKGDLQ